MIEHMFDTVDAHLIAPDPTPPSPVPEDAGDLIDELAALLSRRDRLDARIAAVVDRVGVTKAFQRDGYPSRGALLRHRMSLHPGEANRLVARANALSEARLVAEAFESGALTGSKVDLLLDVRSRAPKAFASVEGPLVSVAVAVPFVDELRKILDYWLDLAVPTELAVERDFIRSVRSLVIRRDGELVRFAGWTDVESGERMRAILDPGPPSPGDTRSASARRADVLVDVIVNAASARPDIIVHVTPEVLTRQAMDEASERDGLPLPTVRAEAISETSFGTFLTADEIQRIACDSTVTRVVFDAESQPIDVGRTRRLVTPAQRTAVRARDLTCVFPTCDRPPQWCDVHHLIPWARGGVTAVDNLVLLCRHHHTLVHEAGWTITGSPGSLRFWRGDGTELDTNPPPRLPRPSPWFTSTTENTPLPPGWAMDILRAKKPRRPHAAAADP